MKRFAAVCLAVLALAMFPSSVSAMEPATEKVVNLPTIALTVIGGVIGTVGGPAGAVLGASIGAGLGAVDVAVFCTDKEIKGYPCTSENGTK